MSKIAAVGEAYGEAEERERTAFVGSSGYELRRMLEEAGIQPSEVFFTNVFNLRPNGNKIETLCGPKEAAIRGYPALVKGKYVRSEFVPELERLGNELCQVNPNLIIALGNTPTWALTGRVGISKIRGTTAISTHTVSGFKVLSTYHPAAVLRQWELRPVAVIDLQKAKREAEFPEVRRPHRKILVPETPEEIHEFRESFIESCSLLACDIETAGSRITCIGFSPRQDLALVVPFTDTRRKGGNYWSNNELELRAWRAVQDILESPIPKLFQNGLYDIAFIWRAYGIKTYGAREDTMLLHHALQPESLKGLGFLGSVYCDEGAWKDMRKVATIKRDD